MTVGSPSPDRRWVLRSTLAASIVCLAGCSLPPGTVETTSEAATDSTANETVQPVGGETRTDRPPTATFTASPREGLGPVLVELDASGSEAPDGSLVDFRWSIDGLELHGPRLAYPFEGDAEKSVRLTVTDDHGRSATRTDRFEFPSPLASSYPTTGPAVPELAAFDDALLDFMADRRITSAALGVAKDGEVVLERGYGWQDRLLTEPTAPDARFRIGSVTKPVALAAVRRLVREGVITYEDRVFGELDLEPPSGELGDERLLDVTVQHLIDHRGGWDLEQTFDPVFHDFPIAEALGQEGPPTPRDVVRYMLGQPLQFTPGEQRAYSNFGYLVLGVYVEAVTGRPFFETLRREVLRPNDIDDVAPGRTRPADRDPREPRYFAPDVGPNVLELDPADLVHLPDGGFHLEKLIAVGDLVASTPGLLGYLDAFWLTGEPRDDGDAHWVFSGTQPGMYAMVFQLPDGIDVAVCFNRRGGGDEFDDIQGVIERTVASVDAWP